MFRGGRGNSGNRANAGPHSQTIAVIGGGGTYDTYEDAKFLDDFAEACGAEAVEFDPKTSCCGGSVSVMSPERDAALQRNTIRAEKLEGLAKRR